MAKVRVGLLVTCLVDLMRPRIGFAVIRLLKEAGCEVAVPDRQTCCGQPAWNSGDAPAALALAKKTIAEFEHFDYLVIPSGSCAEQVRVEYPRLLAAEAEWRARAEALASRTHELTDFLATVLKVDGVPGDYAGTVTYHDSCSGLRGLGIKAQPRALLATMKGLSLVEMEASEECCGFGGTFSVKFGAISAAIAARKCGNVLSSGAQAVVGGDLGCLLNIEGKLRRMGEERIEVLHVAEVLAGSGDRPGGLSSAEVGAGSPPGGTAPAGPAGQRGGRAAGGA